MIANVSVHFTVEVPDNAIVEQTSRRWIFVPCDYCVSMQSHLGMVLWLKVQSAGR